MKAVPIFRRPAEGASTAVVYGDLEAYSQDLARVIGGALELPTLTADGARVPGNVFASVGETTFREAETDTLVAHGLTVATDDWIVVSPGGFARFRKGSRPGSDKGTYIQSDTAGVTAQFLFFASRRRS
jgi:hypothetical protein